MSAAQPGVPPAAAIARFADILMLAALDWYVVCVYDACTPPHIDDVFLALLQTSRAAKELFARKLPPQFVRARLELWRDVLHQCQELKETVNKRAFDEDLIDFEKHFAAETSVGRTLASARKYFNSETKEYVDYINSTHITTFGIDGCIEFSHFYAGKNVPSELKLVTFNDGRGRDVRRVVAKFNAPVAMDAEEANDDDNEDERVISGGIPPLVDAAPVTTNTEATNWRNYKFDKPVDVFPITPNETFKFKAGGQVHEGTFCGTLVETPLPNVVGFNAYNAMMKKKRLEDLAVATD